jgi:hypothetical protein
MKYALVIVGATSICPAMPASAEEVGIGVGVTTGAEPSVTVGSDQRDRFREQERTAVIKEREPQDTTIVKGREREPDRKVIIEKALQRWNGSQAIAFVCDMHLCSACRTGIRNYQSNIEGGR